MRNWPDTVVLDTQNTHTLTQSQPTPENKPKAVGIRLELVDKTTATGSKTGARNRPQTLAAGQMPCRKTDPKLSKSSELSDKAIATLSKTGARNRTRTLVARSHAWRVVTSMP